MVEDYSARQRITVHERGPLNPWYHSKCSTPPRTTLSYAPKQQPAEDYSARQRITVHGRGLQCMAEDYSARQRITVHGRGLQCKAEDYSARQRITVHGRGLRCTEDYSGTLSLLKFAYTFKHILFIDLSKEDITMKSSKSVCVFDQKVYMQHVPGHSASKTWWQRITVHGRGLQCTAEDYSAREGSTKSMVSL